MLNHHNRIYHMYWIRQFMVILFKFFLYYLIRV